nr:hypothetical protein Iba_chr14eCG10100 [Ipomoea batatas]
MSRMPGTFCLRSLESFVISTSPRDRKQNDCDSASFSLILEILQKHWGFLQGMKLRGLDNGVVVETRRGNKLASLVRLTTVTSSESFHTSAELFRRASVPSDDVRSTIGVAPRVTPSSASSSHNIAMEGISSFLPS